MRMIQFNKIQFKKYLLFRAKKYNYQFIKSWDKSKEPTEASLRDAGPIKCKTCDNNETFLTILNNYDSDESIVMMK